MILEKVRSGGVWALLSDTVLAVLRKYGYADD